MGRVRAEPSKTNSTQSKGWWEGAGQLVFAPKSSQSGRGVGWDRRQAGRGGWEVGRALQALALWILSKWFHQPGPQSPHL